MGLCPPKGRLNSPTAPAAAAAQSGTGSCYLNIRTGYSNMCSNQPRNMAPVNLSSSSRGGASTASQYLELGEASRVAVSQGASQKGNE